MTIPDLDPPPSAPDRATGGAVFDADATAFAAWLFTFVAQMTAMATYIKEQAEAALAAAHLAGLPSLSSKAGQLVKVSSAGALSFIRYATANEARAGTNNSYLMTPLRTMQVIEDQRDAQAPDVQLWDHGISGNASRLYWQGLSQYSHVRIDFLNLDLSTDDVVRMFRLSNAAGSMLTSGYVVSSYDDATGHQGTDGIRIHDAHDGLTHIGYIEFHNMNNPNVPTTFDGVIHMVKIVGFHNSSQIHDKVELTLGGATATGGAVMMTGHK